MMRMALIILIMLSSRRWWSYDQYSARTPPIYIPGHAVQSSGYDDDDDDCDGGNDGDDGDDGDDDRWATI